MASTSESVFEIQVAIELRNSSLEVPDGSGETCYVISYSILCAKRRVLSRDIIVDDSKS